MMLILSSKLQAQNLQTDSAAFIEQKAYAYGRYFRPTKPIRKAYRKHTLTSTSDYFMPTKQTVPNSDLLNDSVFVQVYKEAAYDNSVRKIKSNRAIIWGGSVVIAGAIVVALIIVKLVEEFAATISKSLI